MMELLQFNALAYKVKGAASDNGDGYRRGAIKEGRFLAHRVAWALFYGDWPTAETDHINGDRSDNRIENLRVVPTKINQRNAKIKANNTSGYCGVSKHKKTGKWTANITVDRVMKHLGYHNCITSAMLARRLAERGHDFTKRHGT